MSKKKESCRYPLDPLVDVMESLWGKGLPLGPGAGPSSLRRYLLEECYEVIEAIEENNMHKLCESGRLITIVFHARLAQARGFFPQDVVAGVTAKMIRRHPMFSGMLWCRTARSPCQLAAD